MQRASLRVLKGGCRGPTNCSWCRFDSSGIPAGKSLTGSCPKNQHRAWPPSLVLGQGRSEPSGGHQTQPNQIQPNQPKPNPTNPNPTTSSHPGSFPRAVQALWAFNSPATGGDRVLSSPAPRMPLPQPVPAPGWAPAPPHSCCLPQKGCFRVSQPGWCWGRPPSPPCPTQHRPGKVPALSQGPFPTSSVSPPVTKG